MEFKKTKETAKRLGKDERYNACPKCGSEVYLYIYESGEYCVGCVECEEHNIESIEYGLPLGIYLMLENKLEYLGCSSLVWEIVNR